VKLLNRLNLICEVIHQFNGSKYTDHPGGSDLCEFAINNNFKLGIFSDKISI